MKYIIPKSKFDKITDWITYGYPVNITDGHSEIVRILRNMQEQSNYNIMLVIDLLIDKMEKTFRLYNNQWKYFTAYRNNSSTRLMDEMRIILNDLYYYPFIKQIKQAQQNFKRRFYAQHLELILPFIHERGINEMIFTYL